MAYFGTLAPYIAPQGGPNGVNHISMYLGYHNIEIKTRDILKLNFGIWMIDCMKHGLYVKPTGCLITDPSKVEAFYAHLGWNFWVFWTMYSKIILVHLISNSENGHYVIIVLSADIYSWQIQLTAEFTLHKGNYFKDTVSKWNKYIFRKKVNKQLKSADIFFQT